MTQTSMTIARVLELIETYGADVQMWPEGERDAAEMLVVEQPDVFSDALKMARALDIALKTDRPAEPSPHLTARILGEAPGGKPRHFKQLIGWAFPQGVRWPAGAVLSSLAIGVVGGYAYASGTPADVSVSGDEAYYSAFGYSQVADWLVAEESE